MVSSFTLFIITQNLNLKKRNLLIDQMFIYLSYDKTSLLQFSGEVYTVKISDAVEKIFDKLKNIF